MHAALLSHMIIHTKTFNLVVVLILVARFVTYTSQLLLNHKKKIANFYLSCLLVCLLFGIRIVALNRLVPYCSLNINLQRKLFGRQATLALTRLPHLFAVVYWFQLQYRFVCLDLASCCSLLSSYHQSFNGS